MHAKNAPGPACGKTRHTWCPSTACRRGRTAPGRRAASAAPRSRPAPRSAAPPAPAAPRRRACRPRWRHRARVRYAARPPSAALPPGHNCAHRPGETPSRRPAGSRSRWRRPVRSPAPAHSTKAAYAHTRCRYARNARRHSGTNRWRWRSTASHLYLGQTSAHRPAPPVPRPRRYGCSRTTAAPVPARERLPRRTDGAPPGKRQAGGAAGEKAWGGRRSGSRWAGK